MHYLGSFQSLQQSNFKTDPNDPRSQMLFILLCSFFPHETTISLCDQQNMAERYRFTDTFNQIIRPLKSLRKLSFGYFNRSPQWRKSYLKAICNCGFCLMELTSIRFKETKHIFTEGCISRITESLTERDREQKIKARDFQISASRKQLQTPISFCEKERITQVRTRIPEGEEEPQ